MKERIESTYYHNTSVPITNSVEETNFHSRWQFRERLPPIADLIASVPESAVLPSMSIHHDQFTSIKPFAYPVLDGGPRALPSPIYMPPVPYLRPPIVPPIWQLHPATVTGGNSNGGGPRTQKHQKNLISSSHATPSHSGSRRPMLSEADKRARKAAQQQYRRKFGPTREARERFSAEEDRWLVGEKKKLESEPNKHWTDVECSHKAAFPYKSFRTLSGLQSRYYRIKKKYEDSSGLFS